MSRFAIVAERLAKRYRIPASRASYETLRGTVATTARRLVSHARDREDARTVWALDDISFEVEHGTTLGIIGRNGAGKTSLLRILSRITRPTRGRALISGTSSALLSVGTGFHQELSGRDNIFLNGAILGMNKSYIRRRFDEIVAFAEVEKFIDTPVKYYSSGMQMRLGFAVASHLDADILFIDEVLAVGDAAFQRKCLARVDDVAHSGRTVLFVSHHLGSVSQLCTDTLWLEGGRLVRSGRTADVVAAYLASVSGDSGHRTWDPESMSQVPGDDALRLRSVSIRDAAGAAHGVLDLSQPFDVDIEYDVLRPLSACYVYFTLRNATGVPVFTSPDTFDGTLPSGPRQPGRWRSRCTVMGNLLNEGDYHIDVIGSVPFEPLSFEVEAALTLSLEQTGGVAGSFSERWPGVVCPSLPWVVERLASR